MNFVKGSMIIEEKIEREGCWGVVKRELKRICKDAMKRITKSCRSI